MWPPPAVQVSARTFRAVVLPAPAGAITSCTRRRSVATVRTICRLPGVQHDAAGGGLGQPEVDRDRVERPSVGPVRGGQEALLGGEDPGRGVLVAAGDGEHRRPVGPAQMIRQHRPGRRRR